MKASAYKQKLIDAKYRSVKYRWELYRDDPNASVESCHFCLIASGASCIANAICPLRSKDLSSCCNGLWWDWINNHSKETAQAIIDLITAVDVDAWTQHLVELGMLEEEGEVDANNNH